MRLELSPVSSINDSCLVELIFIRVFISLSWSMFTLVFFTLLWYLICLYLCVCVSMCVCVCVLVLGFTNGKNPFISESDTMFNERDRSCTAVQHMPSTDPSYDHRTIASTLKMQIWIATNNRGVPGRRNKVSGYGYSFNWGPHHATSHLWSRLESQQKSVPGFSEECGDPLVQSGGRWQTLVVAAGLGAGRQVQRDPGLASEGVLRLFTLLSLPFLPPTRTRWTTSFGHLSKTSPIWPPTVPKPAWSPPSAEYSPSLGKRHALNCGSISRRWLRLKAATLNRYLLYNIIKLPELIFSIKVLK